MKTVFAYLFFATSLLWGSESYATGPFLFKQEMKPLDTHKLDSLAIFFRNAYKDDASRLKAVYVWVTSNIAYDVDKMFTVRFSVEDTDKDAATTLQTKRGSCADYVALFSALTSRLGFKSYSVSGYTKQNDQIDFVPHAWCVLQLNGVWQLFDPTWDAGSVVANRFRSAPTLTFFACDPQVFIRTHMPFDPMWQLLTTPMSYSFFDTGKLGPKATQPASDYNQLIAQYDTLDPLDKLLTTKDRIQKGVPSNSIIMHYLSIIEFNSIQLNDGKLAQSYTKFNEAVIHYNQFISFLNKQFKPAIPDSTLEAMLKRPIQLCKEARQGLAGLKRPVEEIATNKKTLIKAIDELENSLGKYDAWLAVYLKKSKVGRVIWFAKLPS